MRFWITFGVAAALVVWIVVSMALGVFEFRSDGRGVELDAERWSSHMTHPADREAMARDLVRSRRLVGMTPDQVRELLGWGVSSYDRGAPPLAPRRWTYGLRSVFSTYSSLVVDLREDRVTRAWIRDVDSDQWGVSEARGASTSNDRNFGDTPL